MPNELVPVCSPEFLRAHPDLTDAAPENLRNVPLLHSLARREDWAKWLDAAGVRGVNPLSGLSYESSVLAYFAATQGQASRWRSACSSPTSFAKARW